MIKAILLFAKNPNKWLLMFLSMLIACSDLFAQRIVNNITFIDIDDVNVVDTIAIKKKFFQTETSACYNNQQGEDSCVVYSKSKYDESGKLVQLTKGSNLQGNQIDYVVQYKKLSDSLYESIVRYPKGSTKIPSELFIDSMFKGRTKKVSLYKNDKNNNLVMRSVYKIKEDGTIDYIKRFDIDDNLIQIFYPLGNRKPLREWTDTISNKFGKEIQHNAIYLENQYQAIIIYNTFNKPVQTVYATYSFNSGSNDYYKTSTIYNELQQPVLKISMDVNNQIIEEERSYYRNNKLIRYTKSSDAKDSTLNEERLYDDTGKIILFKSHPRHSERQMVWKYFYSMQGLRERDEYFVNNVMQFRRRYIYK